MISSPAPTLISVSALSNQWIDLFRAGDHGSKGSFTPEDVQAIVDNYKPEFHEAPAVLGHPANDAPAYGWWEKVRRVGDVLQGKLKDDVNPAFEEAVRARKFPKRSVSLYKGPQGYSLRHVGFLGAMPPEVKGLADVKFDDEQDQKAIEIEFSEETGMAADATQIDDKQFGERMTAFFSNLFGNKPATATFSEAQVKDIATQAAKDATEAALKPFQTQFSEREKTLATSESQARADAAIQRVKAKGAWVPAFDKAGLPLIFADLAAETVTVEFGEGTNKAQKTKLELFTNFMEELKAIVPAAAVYTGQAVAAGPTSASAKAAGVNDTFRAPADPNSMQLSQLAQARANEKNIDFGTALSQVAQEKPELTIPGGATAGSV